MVFLIPLAGVVAGFVGIFTALFSRLTFKWILAGLYVVFQVIGPVIQKLLYVLGFTAVTVTGVNLIYDQFKTLLLEKIGQLPVDVISILGLMQLDVAFTMIMSSIIMKQVINGWHEGTRTHNVWKKPRVGWGDSHPGNIEI